MSQIISDDWYPSGATSTPPGTTDIDVQEWATDSSDPCALCGSLVGKISEHWEAAHEYCSCTSNTITVSLKYFNSLTWTSVTQELVEAGGTQPLPSGATGIYEYEGVSQPVENTGPNSSHVYVNIEVVTVDYYDIYIDTSGAVPREVTLYRQHVTRYFKGFTL